MISFAHGIGARADLPVPLWLAVYGAAAAVLISFFVLAAFWTEPKFTGGAAGRPLPPRVQRGCDSAAARVGLRGVGLALLALTLGAAWLGSDNPLLNPAPTWLYVWLWVGLAPLSVLFGPVWRLLNPLRAIAGFFTSLGVPTARLPAAVGYWPAAASLLVFVWIELVYDASDEPATVAWFVTGYAGIHTLLGVIFGQRWFDRGDGFEAYSTLLGHLSALGRRDDGQLVLRSPFNSLATLTRSSGPIAAPGLVTVIAVLLGSTGFDGVTGGLFWKDLVATYGVGSRTAYLLLGTAGLVGCVAFVLISYGAATRSAREYAPADSADAIELRFAHSLLPIVFGYTVAHYFSLAVFQGQAGFFLASDPFDLQWNLLGLDGSQIDYSVVSPTVIALVQVGAIVAGHVVGVISAHDRAVAIFPRDRQGKGQYGLLAVMVAYTIAGITLVVGP